MRRAARVDKVQKEIVDGLRRLGCEVQTLAPVGGGVPDLLVGWRGQNFLLECKTPGIGRLTQDQERWHKRWQGQVAVVTSLTAALEEVGAL